MVFRTGIINENVTSSDVFYLDQKEKGVYG